MDEQINFKEDAKSLSVMVIIQMLLAEILALIIGVIMLAMRFDQDLTTYFSLIVSSCVATYYVIKHYQKKFSLKISYKTDENFDVLTYLKFVVMTLGAAWLASMIIGYIMELLSGVIVFDTPEFLAKYDLVTNIFLCISTIIVAPITEELLFRGIMLGKLKQYGNVFAIVVVSILFGLLHGNLPQTIPAFVTSLFLCQLTLKSNSIVPAISIHIINNAVAQLADINNALFQIFLNAIIIIVIITAIILIIREYRNGSKYKIEFKVTNYFKNWAGILILIFTILSIIGSIQII